jgi:hypothetical protein
MSIIFVYDCFFFIPYKFAWHIFIGSLKNLSCFGPYVLIYISNSYAK